MNKVIMMGRLTKDPDIRYTQSAQPTCVARYTLAVDRRYKREGDQTADFPSCIAFGRNGEFAEKYLRKGTKIVICGRLQTGNYTKQDGTKVYTTDVVVEEQYFAESKSAQGNAQGNAQGDGNWTEVEDLNAFAQSMDDGFMRIPDDVGDEGLPFC